MPLENNTIQAQNGVVRYLKDNMGTLIGLLAMCVILSFTTNGVFYSQRNLVNAALFPAFALCWAVNGWAQSMGAPPAIISLSRWFPLRIRGTFYGFFSSSHNIGEGLSFVFVSAIVAALGWKWGFFGAALAGVLGIVIILLFLHNSTESKGLPSIEALAGEPQPAAVPASEKRAETRRLQAAVVRNPGVWILAIASAFMYMSRYAINEWGIIFLQEARGYSLTEAGAIVGINPIFGVLGTVFSGWLSDAVFKGDRKYPAFVAGVLEAIALVLFLFGGPQRSEERRVGTPEVGRNPRDGPLRCRDRRPYQLPRRSDGDRPRPPPGDRRRPRHRRHGFICRRRPPEHHHRPPPRFPHRGRRP